jgi:hypothetical protein
LERGGGGGPQGEFCNTKAKRNITNSIYGLNVEKQIPFEKTKQDSKVVFQNI